jgi:hypothetical protein
LIEVTRNGIARLTRWLGIRRFGPMRMSCRVLVAWLLSVALSCGGSSTTSDGGAGGGGGGGGGATPDLAIGPDLAPPGSSADPHKVDVLFMVDNSSSMSAMQDQLRAHFADFLLPFQNLATAGKYVDLHLGVVTSDYGAGAVSAASSGCSMSPGGQHGFLQALGVAAPADCVSPKTTPFIAYTFGPNGVATASNLPDGQDLVKTFTCMASVGATGCGFEHQLESVYAALHNTTENAGFLRDDAQLAIVFLTNEDDGSAPADTDLFDRTKTTEYGAYDTYRQTRFGIACGTPPALPPEAASMGPLVGCHPAPNNAVEKLGLEFDVSRYIDFLTAPASAGGLKINPGDVFLVAIDAPDDRVETVVVHNGTGLGVPPNAAYVPCDPATPSPTCLVRVQHSCQNTVDPSFFGDPAVRLNAVVRAARHSQISSICGSDPTMAPADYSQAMRGLATELASRIP